MADMARLTLSVDSTQVKKGEAALDEFTQSGVRAEKQTSSLKKEVDRLKAPLKSVNDGMVDGAASSGKFSNGARNLSMQLSQVAQQGSATGNYLQALAIQLPDIMLSFGTLGILIGAAAGALGSTFATAAMAAQKETNNLSEEIDDLTASFDKLGVKQRELLRLKIADETSQLALENRKLAGDVQTATFQLDKLIQSYDRGRIDILEFNEQEERLNRIIAEGQGKIEANNQTIKERAAVLDGSAKAAEDAAKAEEEAARMRERLQSQVDSIRGLDPYVRAEQEFSARSEILKSALAEDLITAQEFQYQDEMNYKAYQERLTAIGKKETEQRSQFMTASQQNTLAHTGQFFGNLAQIAQAGGKKQFDNYKRMAQAQAAISAALAINAIWGDATLPTVLKIPFVATVGALTAVNIAQIEQQEYQPRALGGQMRANGQYLVGERGPELITMGNRNANITPTNQLGGGNAVTQNLVIQVSANTAADVQAQVMRMMPAIQSAALSAVQSQARKGGAFSRSIGAR